MGKIVLIGGGGIGSCGLPYETAPADTEIICLAGKSPAAILYIGYANRNDENYRNSIYQIFQQKYHCHVDWLTWSDLSNPLRIWNKICVSDVIYVGGGDTSYLIKLLQQYHIDQMLRTAFHKDKVLCGISAGAICWCRVGWSASLANSTNRMEPISGINLIDIFVCPHYSDPVRRELLQKMLITRPGTTAVGIDYAAVRILNSEVSVIPFNQKAIVERLSWNGKEFIKDSLIRREKLPLAHISLSFPSE